ncbi:sugar-phosphatase [Mangrovibacter phragmitis]|uniref:Sugar-phosphatase n=1 Tax=Mangrovibacter phragmitis TaxID=1691903 RepID=A0A1B7L753_9ENTR|nr:Cof-type HAD-IIB family hydrolase [Mangrovibacter phragmitis]OAT78177.1 sugar-phosphatase [Mangrovibacter phragmitis]
MNVKVIAVDMDGTFLTDQKTYDKERFMLQYQAMGEQGIRFVVASGNQYYQLISFFPEIKDKIAFVAENGALIYDQGEQVHHGELSKDDTRKIADVLAQFDGINYVTCGLNSAWYQQGASEAFISLMKKHYHRLQPVEDVYQIDDTIFKYSLNLDDKHIPELVNQLNHALDGVIHPVTSGYGFVDLIIPGSHKASGLRRLLKRWGVSPEYLVAVGDSANDVEMLHYAGFSFAMGNAAQAVKDTAEYQTASNNQSGALDVIDAVLQHQPPFK